MSWFRLLALVGVVTIDLAGVFTRPALAQDPVRVSVSTTGLEANGSSYAPFVSVTGRFVAFCSLASNLVPNDTNGVMDVFLHDRDVDADGLFDEPGAVATTRIGEPSGADPNGRCWSGPKVTPDGRYVVFGSLADQPRRRYRPDQHRADLSRRSADRRDRAGQPRPERRARQFRVLDAGDQR